MKSIGVDLHKCSLTVVVLDEQGQIVERRDIPTKCHNQIRDYFASYGLQCQVAVESVGFYQWFWDLVHPVVGRLALVDPANLKTFRGRKAKSDRNDALLIARLLREDRLPLAYVPPEPIRHLRDLVRLRHSLARWLAAARHQLRWIALKRNLPGPPPNSLAITPKNGSWLRKANSATRNAWPLADVSITLYAWNATCSMSSKLVPKPWSRCPNSGAKSICWIPSPVSAGSPP